MKACEHGGTMVRATCPGKPDLVIGCVHLEDGEIVGYVAEKYSLSQFAEDCVAASVKEAARLRGIGEWPAKETP